LYADDISLQLCNAGPLPPPPAGDCTNQVVNGSFEYNGSWGIPYTLTRLLLGGLRLSWRSIDAHGHPSIHLFQCLFLLDAWQTIYIPTGSTSAQLQMYLLPRSQEAALTAEAESPDPNRRISIRRILTHMQ